MTGAPLDFPVRGLADAEARLLSADPPLEALHCRSGGSMGGEILIPQLAALVRLVGRLGVPAFRSVCTADGGADLELAVHARPDVDGIRLEIGAWEVKPPSGSAGEADGESALPMATDAPLPLRDGFGWAVDAQLQLTELDPAATALLRVDPASWRGMAITRLIGLEAGPGGAMPMLDGLAHQRAFVGQRAHPLGVAAPAWRLAGLPLFDAAGRFIGFRGQAVGEAGGEVPPPPATPVPQPDIEPEREAQIGSDIGEALRAPLDLIISNADVIRDRGDGPLRRGYADYAADIASAGRHLMSLVEDMVEVQTIEQPGFAPALEAIDLREIARQAVALVAARARARNIEIVQPDESEALPATGEGRRVLQILVNLLGNAVRYAPEGSRVTIAGRRDGRQALLVVADEGPGIDAADQQRIFEKFERLGRSDAGGSGLGLYISRRLARAMGGELSVESAPGRGARFSLALPSRLD